MSSHNLDISVGSLLSKSQWYLKTVTAGKFLEAGLDITHEQWILLLVVNARPGLSQTEIAATSLKDKTNVTRILDLLERDDYLRREPNPRDRRAYCIFLTEKGKAVLDKTIPLAVAANRQALTGFSEQEEEQLKEYLQRIMSNLLPDSSGKIS